jgi:hypothetical protein
MNAYNEYNNTWYKVKNIIENIITTNGIFDICDISYRNESDYPINKIIYNNKYIDIKNNFAEIIKYFSLSRVHVIEELNNAKHDVIIELGSGWGRNIFHYLLNYNIDIDIISGEYTEFGVKCQEMIKNKYFPNKSLFIDYFDYNNSGKFFDNIKNKYKNPLIISFWSVEQITFLNNSFIDNLLNIADNMTCIHLEPVGWQINDNVSFMKEHKYGYRSYYNKNLYSKLKEYENNMLLKIDDIKINHFNFDSNETCGTLIKWKKINKT